MKKFLLITIISLTTAFFLPYTVAAQKTGTSTTATQEKKAAEELNKAKEEQLKLTQDQLRLMEEKLKADYVVRVGPEGDSRHGISVFSSGDNFWQQQGGYGMSMRGMPRTSWDLSRSVTENSSVKEYTFEVENEMKSLSISVSGMSKSGEIRIQILMPGSKHYSEVVIDEFGSLNWKKSFELKNEDKDKFGLWKFKVTTSKASGNFRISLSAN